MELFAVFLFLLCASQDSLAVTVEVQEGEPSVVLPCHISKILEEIVTVKWSRFDLNPNNVHQRREADDLHGQNQVFRGRTSMIPDALDSGDFSLTLREPQLLDSGIYICSMTENQEETALSGVQLHVKASQDSLDVSLDVYQGDSSVVLPCQNSQSSEGILTVKWSRFDLNPNTVHLRREGDDLQAQNVLFSGRTSMRSDAVDVGDFSLTLREPQLLDSGVYICSIHQETEEKMLSGIRLNVKVYRVEVDSGEESVLLPFKTAACLSKDVTVTWRHNTGRMVHGCYREVFMCSVDFENWPVQHYKYKDRTKIVKEGKFGDYSLILKKPTDRDTGTYSCTVYDYWSDKILIMKQVLLDVKAGPDSLIIAIDFGSGFSGYAFNVKPREEGGETQIKRWSNGLGLDTPKTPTCILFDEHGEFMKFGYEAKTAFNNMRGEETKKHYFFEDFKWNVLNMRYWRQRTFTDNNNWMLTLEVFTEVLRFLKDDALKTIRSQPEGGKFTASEFTWVLTVPDILKDSTKELIIKSAALAGLVTDDTKSKVMVVLESEAALTWCLKLQPDGFITQNHSRDSQDQPAGAAEPDTSCNDPAGSQEAVQFTVEPEETKVLLETQRDGKRYLVVDCGAYSHFTVHEVLEGGAMKKLHNDSRYYLGGRNVDEKFKQFLREIFSYEVWREYEEKFPKEVQKMMYDFTRLKHLGEDIQISCPGNLVMLAQKKKEIKTFFDSVEGASWDDGSIRISREKLKSFYDKSLQGITGKLREILNKDFNIGYIVLVGGFAESQILHQNITDQFGPQYKVLCPLRPQEAILKGAVELGRNPKLVES
ncbi:heat shock 70 kDa protein 12B-like isoform X2 [Xiphophorus maculatus]|uniref:heat shock 70 kDa protein 12B-like isoform X2 n=1 Tax=Xiphophorus maculatus TaxID=8083 RepID=UPI000C6DC996|nr:heat shock 70 kDa protein 12B-like isoform X2 [Xiphophorus maculatus]